MIFTIYSLNDMELLLDLDLPTNIDTSSTDFGSCEIHGPVLLQELEAIEMTRKRWVLSARNVM